MELPETVETLNKRLIDYYGYFEGDMPNYRVSWVNDLRELRREGYGFREVPKYNYLKDKYILEKLVPVDSMSSNELLAKLSYECIFVFEDKEFKPLPPKWELIELVIYGIHKFLGKEPKKPSFPTTEEELVAKAERIDKLEQELFGNESQTTDALAHKQGVVVPSNYKAN